MLSKKIVFWISFIGTLFLCGAFFLEGKDFCYLNNVCDKIFGLVNLIGFDLLIFPVILFFSLITYKMIEGVFKAWIKFTICYMTVFVIVNHLLMSLPHSGGGWGIPDLAGLIFAYFLFLLLIIFILISSILIYKKHSKNKNKVQVKDRW